MHALPAFDITLPVSTAPTGEPGAGGAKVGKAVGLEVDELDGVVLGCAEGVVWYVRVHG